MKKVAIIGLGKWGKNLLEEFSKKTVISKCMTKGNSKNILWLHKHFPEIQHSKNYKDILNDKSIDAIIIATPIPTHYSLIHNALNSGKHVFTEKPLTDNLSEAKSLQLLAKKKNLCLFVGHTSVYHPVVTKIKKLMKNDPILYFSMKWNKFGTFNESILFNLLSHDVSILLELIGFPKKLTIISSKGVISKQDFLTVKVDFSKTCSGMITIDRISDHKEKSITLVSKNHFLLWKDYDLYKLNKKTKKLKKIFHSDQNSISNEITKFLNLIKSGHSDKHNLQLSIDSVKLISKLVN